MKKIYTSLVMLCVVVLAHAQIPNSGFENWTSGQPNGWYFYGSLPTDSFMSQSSNAHGGSYALRFNVRSQGGIASGGYIYTGDSADYNFPISSLPQALHMWYIGVIALADSGATLLVNSQTSSAGLVVGQNTDIGISQPSAVWKEYVTNYSSWTGGTGADSAYIEFGVQNIGGNLSTATYFIIDDLSFGSRSTGISQIEGAAVLESCSPNPATGTANIFYSLSGRSTVSLDLYDMTGRHVRSLLSGIEQTEGRYKVPTDVSELSNGVYMYTLTVDGHSFSQKLIVSK